MIAVLFVALTPREDRMRTGVVRRRVVVFALGSLAPDDTWSPYYRVTVHPADDAGGSAWR